MYLHRCVGESERDGARRAGRRSSLRAALLADSRAGPRAGRARACTGVRPLMWRGAYGRAARGGDPSRAGHVDVRAAGAADAADSGKEGTRREWRHGGLTRVRRQRTGPRAGAAAVSDAHRPNSARTHARSTKAGRAARHV